MKAKLYILLLITGLSFQSCETEVPYSVRIEKMRLEKDFAMRNSPDSPFADNVYAYKGLDYYPPDERYKIEAKFIPYTGIEKVSLATSDNVSREYYRYGYAEFELENKVNRLSIFQPTETSSREEGLFLGFGDATSAHETYGAGRYMDIKHGGGETIWLDFNLAYNPYCAYNDKYSCPIPPGENFLSIAIQAGEKVYKRH